MAVIQPERQANDGLQQRKQSRERSHSRTAARDVQCDEPGVKHRATESTGSSLCALCGSVFYEFIYRFGSALPTSSRFNPFGSLTKTLRMVSLHSTSSPLRERTRPPLSLIFAR